MDITSFIIFIIVLFLYLHITSEWKRSEDLEIYEMDYENNTQLQEVCNLKQPVLFEFQSVSPEFFEKTNLDHFLQNDKNQDVCIKDTHDYSTQTSVDCLVLPFQTAHSLLKSDPQSHLIMENNDDFIEECSHYKYYQNAFDVYLKPPITIRTKYDLCMGSEKAHTPLRYHTNSRHYCIVTQGKIHVKMTPWRSSKHLHPIRDYENLEFFTNMNPWKNSDSDKIKFLEFEVQEGFVLYIPPYWWYSIRYNTYDTIVCNATYNTLMNMVANAKHWMLYFFQQQNIQQKTMKTLPLNNVVDDNKIDSNSDPNPEDVQDSDNVSSSLKVLHQIET